MIYIIFGSIITIFSIYSYAIDVLFGHKTFWQDWSINSSSPLQRSPSDSNITSYVFYVRKKVSSGDILTLHHDILMNILQFLNAKELLLMSSVNKYFKHAIAHAHLWKKLFETFIRSNPGITNDDYILSIFNKESKTLNKLSFHKIFKSLPMNYIACHQSDSLFLVIINKKLYNVRRFIHEHPGGSSVIEMLRNKDATLEFEIANHSNIAYERASAYLLFDTTKILGENY